MTIMRRSMGVVLDCGGFAVVSMATSVTALAVSVSADNCRV